MSRSSANHLSLLGGAVIPTRRQFSFLPDIIGFHVFARSQVLRAKGIVEHLRNSFELSRRAADLLNIHATLFNLGGGFGIPYRRQENELDLELVGRELARQCEIAESVRIVLELGRYLVAESGWYLTSVVGHKTFQGQPAVIVDGGTHQRADMCGLCLRTKADPPQVLSQGQSSSQRTLTHVLGCLSLPADVYVIRIRRTSAARAGRFARVRQRRSVWNLGVAGDVSRPLVARRSGLRRRYNPSYARTTTGQQHP